MKQKSQITATFPQVVCPIDHLPLKEDGSLMTCMNGHKYELDRGIPCIVLSETRYADAFGEQWNKYRVTQLDSYTKTTITTDRLRRCQMRLSVR